VIPTDVIVIRLALALLFGAVIGIERELRQKRAGLKTMSLVCIGSAGFAMMSNTFGASNHNPAQMAAMVVTGIGFVGAGVIMHRDATVQGVTTAATLWAAASVGVAAGLGQLTLAGVLTIAIAFVQLTFPYIEKMIHRNGNSEMK
jgi:putative Mg2+ transporter-C (MgtC) family protein